MLVRAILTTLIVAINPAVAEAPQFQFLPHCTDGKLDGLLIGWSTTLQPGAVAVRFDPKICEGKDA